MTTTVKTIHDHGVWCRPEQTTLAEVAYVDMILVDNEIQKPAVKKQDPRTPAEILADIAKLSVHYEGVEASSRDHDQILYGENGAR